MKRSYFIIIIIFVILFTWIISSVMNVHKAKNRAGILLSPNKSKSVEILENQESSTVFMNFHKNVMVSGANIAWGKFNVNQIKVEWQSEDTLVINAPVNTNYISKEKEIGFFDELVIIEYKEYEQ